MVERVDGGGAPVDGGLWIGVAAMDETMVELTWDGGEPGAAYRLYRVETIGSDIGAAAATPDNLVYSGSGSGFVDSDVVADTFYTYLLTPDDADAVPDLETEPRWTSALTTTDTTPPTDVTGLTAERTEDGVLLRWDRSSDDVEFAAYAVFLVEDNLDDLTYIGGGADEAQTSFLDSDPVDGSVTYAVQAVDFHENRSPPAVVTVSAANS